MHTAPPPATPKQAAFITKLAAERHLDDDTRKRLEDNLPNFTTKQASDTITWLLALPRTAPTPDTDLEGMHEHAGMIFKVQRAVHGNGRLYAKKLVLTDGNLWRFEYAPGAVYTLSADTKLTLERAKEYGTLYGTCVVCGRTLTDEASIEAGIGPVCALKF